MSTEAEAREALPIVRLASNEIAAGPWVFGRQVEEPRAPIPGGELVEVRDPSDRFVGHALFNGESDIRLRWLARGRRTDLARPREFLLRKLKEADTLRRRVLRLPDVTDAYRVVHAEGDDLPGLIVDRLATHIVCEHHALGFWRMRQDVEWALKQLYPEQIVVHRVPSTAVKAEGFDPDELDRLPARPDVDVVIEEHGVRYAVRPAVGHKTGWFCDQRDNRVAVAGLAAGRDVLDVCCNAGGFSLQAARAGARSVRGVDLDEVVLERAQASMLLNQLAVEFVHADAFDLLRDLAKKGERFGLVVVDPHKFIASRERYEMGLAKYLDLNALAFAVLKPGGLMATFSCSGLLPDAAFIGMLFQAARRAGRTMRLLQSLGAGPDHPQRPDFNRSRYLKGALLHVD
jgi:23S rRNA (cytosine1962-C5)-methyltransferase